MSAFISKTIDFGTVGYCQKCGEGHHLINDLCYRCRLESEAHDRVDNDPKLLVYEDIIFYDWPNWGEHIAWIANAPADEIISWAKATREDE